MGVWIEPITNRTSLNTFYNFTDLNRIDNNNEVLNDELEYLGFKTTVKIKKDWIKGQFPNFDFPLNMLYNVNNIRNSFMVLNTTPSLPDNLIYLNYVSANNIEINQKDMYDLAISTKQSLKRLSFTLGGAKKL